MAIIIGTCLCLWIFAAGIVVLAVGMMASLEERRREQQEEATHTNTNL